MSSSNRRGRPRRSSNASSSSSVTSSSEEESRWNNNNNNNQQSSQTGSSNNNSNKPATKNRPPVSIFSGFWSDGELEENKENNRGKSGSSSAVDYEGFYLTIGTTVYEIGLGDVVAMRNPNMPGEKEDANPEEDEEENSRERRRRRRLERERLAEKAPAKDASSDYAVDARSENPSDYYQAATATAATAGGPDSTQGEDETMKDPPPQTTEETAKPASEAEEESAKKPPAASTAKTDSAAAAAAPNKEDAKMADGLMLARVERIWHERRHKNRILFKARWFLKKEDVDSLPLGELTGPISSRDFADSITEHDLVLSNQTDDNYVTTICDLVQVLYRNPKLDSELPSFILPTTYLCRYSLRIDDDAKVVILPYSGEDDDWGDMTIAALNCKKRKADSEDDEEDELGISSRSGLYPDSDSELSYNNAIGDKAKRRRVGDFATAEEGIDEGTTEQRDIQVGKKHQVYVPPFVLNQPIVSRNPIRMWKPGKIDQEGIDKYIEQASQILTPFLRTNSLTQEEPYAPFPTERMEELSRSLEWKRLPTLSSVSTLSSLTTHKVDALREVNIDALLRNLHVSNYNIQAAIAVIEASPMDYITAWSPHEKTRFNTGFRRYSGSLRAIYKGMGNKALRDVIDYHYRFKIPDQFRRFQERKREQAVRMLECIETRRNLNAPIMISNNIVGSSQSLVNANGNSSGGAVGTGADEKRDAGDWTTTGSTPLAVSVEERRVKAKELLLDVEAKLGRDKMMRVMDILKKADETALVHCKAKLLETFRGHQEFQTRFLEFLPQQLRL